MSAIHGHAKTCGKNASPTYESWASMKMRCRNPQYGSYPQYGAKGIDYCDRWETFKNFLEDMGVRPPGTSLDRIDGTKGYTPENCRWATTKEQNENRRSSVWIEYQGNRMLMINFARMLGMRVDTVWYRLHKRKMTPEQIATTPIDPKKSKAGATKCL